MLTTSRRPPGAVIEVLVVIGVVVVVLELGAGDVADVEEVPGTLSTVKVA
jgi:hypothetical protein